MAGLSSRFTRAGYDRPKWMLPLAGRPLLDWSLLGFQTMFESHSFLLVHLDQPGVADFVRARAAALGIRDARLVPLAAPTRGQAETVLLGLDGAGLPEDEPVTIFNIDTIRPGVRPEAFEGCDGWLECFEGEGDHWSFVRPGADGRAAEVTEKVRISNLCCSGLYHFGSATLFREAYAAELAAPSTNELYVAPMYQHMIMAGQDVGYGTIGAGEIFFSGTPAEYEALLADTGALQAAFAA
jgi:hypothetical protein